MRWNRCAVITLLALLPACRSGESNPASSPGAGGNPEVATTAPATPQSPSPTASVSIGPGDFSAGRAFEHVRALAGGIGPRPAGSSGYRQAVRYVQSEFRDMGYRSRLVPFDLPTGDTSWNVVSDWPDARGRRILIGGHLDSVAGSPGANDNASGVAVILELARILARTPEANGIRFVAFGAEEQQPVGGHHLGAAAYVKRERPSAMVSVDMIGLDRRLIVGWMGIGSRRTVAALLRAARTTGVAAREAVLPDWSDNGPFERAGVPAALLWTGNEPNHHRPTDVVRNVTRKALRAVGVLLLEFVTEVDRPG